MKRKIVCICMLAALCSAALMSACGEEQVSSNIVQTSGDNQQIVNHISSPSQSEPKGNSNSKLSLEKQEVFNQDEIKVTATGIHINDFNDLELELLFENDSKQDLTFQIEYTSINGYAVDSRMDSSTSFETDVSAGKKRNETLVLDGENLKSFKIDDIGSVGFSLYVFDPNGDLLKEAKIDVKTNLYGTFKQVYDDSGKMLYNDKDVKIVLKDSMMNTSKGKGFTLYIENNSDLNLTVEPRNTSVDGFMIEPIMWAKIGPGKKCLTSMIFLTDDLDQNKIKNLQNVETSFRAIYPDMLKTRATSFGTHFTTDPIAISQ